MTKILESRQAAYAVMALAYGFGASSLFMFTVFVFRGPWHFVDLDLSAHGVLWLDFGLSMLFILQHSGMVRKPFRRALVKVCPVEFGNAVYAVFSGIALLVVVVLWQETDRILYAPQGALRVLLRIVFLLSVAGFVWGVRALVKFDAFGVSPILGRLRGREPQPARFVAEGPYRWTRHPLYVFMILMIWSYPDLTTDRLLFNTLWTLWIFFGVIMEERDLVDEFGDTYREYQKRVPALIPLPIGLRPRKSGDTQ